MEKTYKQVPFNIELAKKIQSGEVEGNMYVSDNTHNKIRIICFDRKSAFSKIIALEEDKIGVEWVVECNILGQFMSPIGLTKNTDDTISRTIIIELLEEEKMKYEFKPFDKVLVRGNCKEIWRPRLYDKKSNSRDWHFCQDGHGWKYCIPYEGNEHLVGTTNDPK